MDSETFLKAIALCIDKGRNEEIDTLCIRWLKFTANDYGKEGKTAKELLDIVSDLLES
jgi:hypothetical protein